MTPASVGRIKKVLAVLTVILFTSSSVLAQVSSPQNIIGKIESKDLQIELVRSLNIPKESGDISSIFIPQRSNKKQFVFHIQDIHANDSAQKKISGIMEILSNNYEVNSYGFEGANSELKPSVLRFADNPDTNLKIANYMVAKGQLTGGEFFVLKKSLEKINNSALRFEGIENAEQYIRDLKIFKRSLSSKESIDEIIKSIQLRIDRFKSSFFNRDLARFDKLYQAYENREEKNLLSIYKEVQSKSKTILDIDLSNARYQDQYPQMVRMANLIAQEKLNRADLIQQDIQRIQDSLNNSSAAKKEVQNFNALLEKLKQNQMVDPSGYSSWRECFEDLRAFMGNNHLKWMDYPNFRSFAMRLILQEEMMSLEMFGEMDRLIYEIEMKMADKGSPLQKDIIQLAFDVKLLERFLKLEASRSDVDAVRSGKVSLIESVKARLSELEQSDKDKWVGPEESDLLLSQYELANLFYQGAQKREVAFVDRVLEMSNYGNHRVAFVTGGYHTQGIREELERRGVAYATITPKLSSDETTMIKEFSQVYEQGMLGKQSNIFEKSKIVDVLKEVSTEAYLKLDGRERVRVREFMEAIINEGILDLVQEIRQSDQSVDQLDEIAPALQAKLRKNEVLASENVQVQAVDNNLRFSWDSYKSGYLLPSEGLVKLVNALNEAVEAETNQSQLVAARSLGEKGPTRREFIETAARLGGAGFLGRVLGGLGLASLIGAAGCAQNTTITVPPNLSVSASGQVSTLPRNNFVNPVANSPEPRPAVTFTAESAPQLNTRLSGDPSLLSIQGVNVIGTTVNYRLDSSVPLPANISDHFSGWGVSFDDFTTANILESADFSTLGDIVIYVKSDANTQNLKLTIEGESTADPSKKELNFFTLQNTNQGGFYTIPVSSIRGINPSKIYTLAVVADPSVLGTQNASGSFTVGIAGIVPPATALDISANAVVADTATTNLSLNQPSTPNKPLQLPNASVTGGSTSNTSVFGEKANSILFGFDHTIQKYSGMTITRNNFDDNKGAIASNITQDDFLDLSQFPELVFNIEKVSGNNPRLLVLEFVDENRNKVEFQINNFTGAKATVRVPLNNTQFPSSFNFRRVSLINLIAKSSFDDSALYFGKLRVTIQGVSALKSVDTALPVTATDFSNQLRRPAVTRINGGNPAASVVRLSPNLIQVNFATAPGQASPTVNNEFSGAVIFSNDFKVDASGNPEPLTADDFIDMTRFNTGNSFRLNIRSISGEVPRVLKIAFVDAAGIRQEVLVNGVSTNNAGIDIDTTQFVNPNFDRTRVAQIEIVASQPIGDPQSHSGSFQLDFSGFRAAQPIQIGAPLAASGTSNFSGLARVPVFDRGGGSAAGTSVIGETATTAVWNYRTGPNAADAFSSALITSDNNDLQAQPEDFMNLSSFNALRVNVERVNGEDPQNFTVTFKDANNLPADFTIQGYNGSSGSIVIDFNAVNFPPGFDFSRVREISFISQQTPGDQNNHSGSARITVQGLSFLFQTNAQPAVALAATSNFSAPVTRPASPPRTATLNVVGGSTPGTSVQFIDFANRIAEVKYQPQSGTSSGAGTSTDNNDGVVQPEDALDFTTLQASGNLVFNLQLMPGSTVPDRTIIEIVDINNSRYRTQVNGLIVGNQSVSLPLTAALLPTGFDISRIRGFNIVFDAPTVPAGAAPVVQSGTARVQFRGYVASFDVSVGAAFQDNLTTNFSTFGGVTAPSTFGVLAGSTAQTQVNPVAGDPRNRDLVVQTNAPANTFSGLEIVPPAGQRFNITGEDSIKINLQQIAGVLGNLSKDFRVRFVDSIGATYEIALPVIVGTAVPGSRLGYTIFVNDNAIPPAAINKANITSIQLLYVQQSGDAATHTGTVRVTAQSLGKGGGAAVIEIPKVKSIEVNPVGIVTQINMSELILRDQRAIQESILASPDLTNGILPLLQKLMLRYPEFSRSQIADMVDKYSKQVFAGLPSTEVKPIVTKVERALEKLRAADNSFAVIEQGYGLQIEMIGDKIPSKSDIASIVANLKLHPQLFVRLVYTGNNPEALQNVVKQVQDESDFSNRSIGIRFGIVTTTPNALSQELPKIPVSVYNLMNKFGSDFGLKQKPKNSVELKEHTSIIGSADGLKVAEIPFSSSIKINNDITSSGAEYDSDISIVRIAGGHMAVKSYSGLEPEIQATIRDNRVNASDFLSARLEALQSEIKAVIAVLIAA